MERCGVALRTVTFSALVMLGGCNDTKITKLQTVGSPDGRWIVESQLVRNSGPGTNGVSGEVYMSPSSQPKDRTLVLSFTEPGDTNGEVSISWNTKNMLELSPPQNAKIGFQVVRIGGDVDIRIPNRAARR